MELDVLRELTLQVLKARYENLLSNRVELHQFRQNLNSGQITDDVAFQAYKLGLWTPPERLHREEPRFAGGIFPAEDAQGVRSILWHLVGLGLLIPRQLGDERNHFFDLSAYGKEFLAEATEGAYDPSGYVRRLRANGPNLDMETVLFVREALVMLLGRFYRASAVMLGLASENELLALTRLFSKTLSATSATEFQRKISQAPNIKQRFEYFYSRLQTLSGTLPSEAKELDTWLQGIFSCIRLSRNDAGHPIGLAPSRETVYANLNLFLTYSRYLSILKEHLANNAVPSP